MVFNDLPYNNPLQAGFVLQFGCEFTILFSGNLFLKAFFLILPPFNFVNSITTCIFESGFTVFVVPWK